MRKHGLEMRLDTVPECERYEKALDQDYWDCQIRYNTRPENHQAGTCKMGPATDSMAVVDPTLKIHGVQGLRVADASIMPKVSETVSLSRSSFFELEQDETATYCRFGSNLFFVTRKSVPVFRWCPVIPSL